MASSRTSWQQAVRLSSQFSAAFLPSGESAAAEARDAAAVAVARKLVGHLLAERPEGLTVKLTPVTRHGFAIAAGQELHEARSKGWSGTVLAGPWLSAELGLASPQSGKKLIDRLDSLGWMTKGRRVRGGRSSIYKTQRLTKLESVDLFEEHASTVNALVLGKVGVDPVADLVLSARQPGWAYGPDAPGSAVWVHALEVASGRRLGLSTRTRAAARAWLSTRGLDVPGLLTWVTGRSRPGTLASIEKETAEQTRAERSTELKALTDEHRERVRAAGEHLREVALDLCEHPGRRRSVSALVPGPEQGPDKAAQWLADAYTMLAERGISATLMPEIQKQLRAAFESAGNATLIGDLDAQRARAQAAREHLVTAARAAASAPGRRTTLAALAPTSDSGVEVLKAWLVQLQRGLIRQHITEALLGQVGAQLQRALVSAGHPEQLSTAAAQKVVADLRRRGTDISANMAA